MTMIFMAAVQAIVAIFIWRMPSLTRPTIFFTVTVEPGFRLTPPAAGIIARYRRDVLLHIILAAIFFAAIVVLCSQNKNAPCGLLMSLPLFWQLAGLALAVYHARSAVLPYAISAPRIRQAALNPPRENRSQRLLTILLFLTPLVMIVLGGLYLGWRWDDIPQRFPIHWDAAGEVNGWSTRSVEGVFGLLLFALVAYIPPLVTFLFMSLTRRTAAAGPAALREMRLRRLVKLSTLLLSNFMTAFIVFLAVWLPFRASHETPLGPILVIFAVELSWIIGFIALYGRMKQGEQQPAPVTAEGGLAIAMPAEQSDIQPIGDGTPDRAWKGGLFYYNPDDPAIMVEKRFGIGWTLNFGNKWSWIILISILTLSLLIPAILLWPMSHNTSTSQSAHSVVLPAKETLAETGHPFVDDTDLIGVWRSVAYVADPAEFNPDHPAPDEKLYFKSLVIQPEGVVAEPPAYVWTKGILLNRADHTVAHYQIRQINGRNYLFFEWISGDVTIRGMKPHYYVLRRE
jgi:uncharacterized membrane protein